MRRVLTTGLFLLLTACPGTGGGGTPSTPRTIPAQIDGWRVVTRFSPKQRTVDAQDTLPETVEVRGLTESDGGVRALVYLDVDPNPSATSPLFIDLVVAPDGTASTKELTATPFMDGQAWYFPGEADAWTSMRSSELAAYNNDVVRWTAPNTYVFRNQRLQSTSLNFRCAAQGQVPEVQDLCDRSDHNGTLDIPWAKFPFDSVIRETGELVIAESPYPTTNDRHLLWVRMGLQANRNLEVLQSNYLVVASNNEYFTPDGVSATSDGTSMFGVLAGRLGVTGSTMRDMAGFVATRYEPATNAASVLGTVDGFDAVEPRGAIDHASGTLAFIGRKATQATLPAPEGTTQYDQRDVETVVLFDPATAAFRSLPPLSMRVMQTTDAPGALFSIDILRGWDPTKPKPGSAFWSDGRLYVVLVESVLQTNLRSVVREVVVITPG